MATTLRSSSDQSLSDRITAAPAQELVAMLLEGARGFTTQAVSAIQRQDQEGKAHLVNRVGAIIEQLVVMLNFEEGGEVVGNLARVYEWWLQELLAASEANDAERLLHVARQMEGLGESWQELGVA